MATTTSTFYRNIAGEVFAPLYPYYARLIVEKTGIRSGRCLDVGCGGGHLGLAVAEITDLAISLLDQSAEALTVARENIEQHSLASRTDLIQASVESIPLPDASFDLIVSRGSVPFWQNLAAAFGEIWRVLKPDGQAYIGGGLGTPEMREKIQTAMRQRDPQWHKQMQTGIPRRDVSEYSQALYEAGIRSFNVDKGDEGTWIRFSKPPVR